MERINWEATAKDYQQRHADAMESLGIVQTAADAALQKIKDDEASHQEALAAAITSHKAAVAAALELQAQQLEAKHTQHIERLKQQFLLPALADFHKRQAADLQAKQLAEFETLKVS